MFENFFVLGHRGMGKDHPTYPENTMLSFREAYKMTTYCECDVRRTKDGKIVVFHDMGFDRVAKKYHSRMFKDCSWNDLKDLDLYPTMGQRTGKPPLLTDLLGLVSSDSSRVIFIELKENIGKEVIQVIRSFDTQNNTSLEKKQVNIISQHLTFLKDPISLKFPEIGFISRDKIHNVNDQIWNNITNVGFSYYVAKGDSEHDPKNGYIADFKRKTKIPSVWVWNPYRKNDILKLYKLGAIGMGSNDIVNTKKCLKSVLQM